MEGATHRDVFHAIMTVCRLKRIHVLGLVGHGTGQFYGPIVNLIGIPVGPARFTGLARGPHDHPDQIVVIGLKLGHQHISAQHVIAARIDARVPSIDNARHLRLGHIVCGVIPNIVNQQLTTSRTTLHRGL